MANEEHLEIIKQGTDVWNEWRKKHPDVKPNLIGAKLANINLSHANFTSTKLLGVGLANTDLTGAIFSGVDLTSAIFSGANLTSSNLSHANLSHVNFTGANLNNADFTDALLISTNLSHALLCYANFTGALIWRTVFAGNDLRYAKGLETAKHQGPSTIGMDTLVQSEGAIPVAFLKGVGTLDTLIEYARSLIANSIEYYTCFISYSSKDQDFAERLYADLQNKGVRCWYAPEDMKIGDKIRPRIDESIRLYDKLLVVLSQSSVASQWVEHEVETAMGKELEGIPNVLFPVRLDSTILECKAGWASHIRLTRHVGDFTLWKDHDEYQKSFLRLLRDLKAEK